MAGLSTRPSGARPSRASPAPWRAGRSPAAWTCHGPATQNALRPHRASRTTLTPACLTQQYS
eukprot:6182743-Heterocapsa_arctica.AAC.1